MHTPTKDKEKKGGVRVWRTQMRDNKSMHQLKGGDEGGCEYGNTDEGWRKHAPTKNEETKGGVSTANTDEG
jgi:hypothetical protein